MYFSMFFSLIDLILKIIIGLSFEEQNSLDYLIALIQSDVIKHQMYHHRHHQAIQPKLKEL